MHIAMEMAHGSLQLNGEESMICTAAKSIIKEVWTNNPQQYLDLPSDETECPIGVAAYFVQIERSLLLQEWKEKDLLDTAKRLINVGWDCLSVRITRDDGTRTAVAG